VITGSITFSCSCPADAASVTVRSRPITRKLVWFTTSGSRIHLARHDRGARLHLRQVDLVEAAARTAGQKADVVADLRQLADVRSAPGQQHVGAGVDVASIRSPARMNLKPVRSDRYCVASGG